MSKKWTIGFLGVTGLAIIAEFYAVLDGNSETQPWTHYIVTYIPSWVALPFIGVFCFWLVNHFMKYYGIKLRRKNK